MLISAEKNSERWFIADPFVLTDNGFRSPFAYWTLGVTSIILSILANAGNLINLFVLTRRHMRSTMTTLLVTLSWADLVPPTLASLNSIFYYHLLPHMNKSSAFLTTNLIARDFFNSFANIFTTFSNWLIVIITTFRLIVVQVKDFPWMKEKKTRSDRKHARAFPPAKT